MNASRWYNIACAAALAAVALAAGPARAQRVTVSGQVTDADNGQPVAGAFIHVDDDDREVMTDVQGRFTLRRVPQGDRVIWATALGYGVEAQPVTLGSGSATVNLALRRDPVRLAAITATVNRFESRRRSFGGSARLMTDREITNSAARDMRDFLLVRAGLSRVQCVGISAGGSGGSDCVSLRGRPAQPVVYVDEVRWGDGLGVLATYRPEEVARVEVYGGGQQVRVYTRWFLEWAANHNFHPLPLVVS
ncbi:MAG TPA: carboxypeptidase regulatory-like domain-containing protein [Longimicrobium sp.]